jgi:Lon protease-like protein
MITLPLLDLSGSEIVNTVIVPLPSSHLPDELTTLNLYGMQLSRPVHKMLIEEAIQKGTDLGREGRPKERAYGYVVQKQSDDSLVGAVGCAAEVLIQAARPDAIGESEVGKDAPIAVLYRGCYRFVVEEVVKTIPYPVAIVDELLDDDDDDPSPVAIVNSDDDDELAEFANLSVGELNQRVMQSLKTLIGQRLEDASNSAVTPLEQSILESANMFMPDQASQEDQAEEVAAVFDVFSASLMDIGPSRKEQVTPSP